MCTAVSINDNGHYFGRTLDIECSYGESVVITPRFFDINFLYEPHLEKHYSIIGVAHIYNGFPLYYDGANECGLCMAGLSFTGNAVYHMNIKGKHNIASYEVIPWILGRCDSVNSAIELLKSTNITPDSFAPELPASPLHWIISDKDESVTVESTRDGLKIQQNSVGVLTNNPDFSFHIANLSQYVNLTPFSPENKVAPTLQIKQFSKGFGSFGLPGDYSSASRFVRAAFVKNHTQGYENQVSRLFKILDSVSVPYGCVINNDGAPHYTAYSSCIDASSGAYYYTTFGCHRINSVRLNTSNLDTHSLISFELSFSDDIKEWSNN